MNKLLSILEGSVGMLAVLTLLATFGVDDADKAGWLASGLFILLILLVIVAIDIRKQHNNINM
jgi:DMSO reductase anchor subunit